MNSELHHAGKEYLCLLNKIVSIVKYNRKMIFYFIKIKEQLTIILLNLHFLIFFLFIFVIRGGEKKSFTKSLFLF
jgi:hypothetical protein